MRQCLNIPPRENHYPAELKSIALDGPAERRVQHISFSSSNFLITLTVRFLRFPSEEHKLLWRAQGERMSFFLVVKR